MELHFTQSYNSPFPISASTLIFFPQLPSSGTPPLTLPNLSSVAPFALCPSCSCSQPVVRKPKIIFCCSPLLAFTWTFLKRSCVSTYSKLIYPVGHRVQNQNRMHRLIPQPRIYGMTMSESLNLIRLRLRELPQLLTPGEKLKDQWDKICKVVFGKKQRGKQKFFVSSTAF